MVASLSLDGLSLSSEADLHDAVERQLVPPVYGRNLDALWDVITAMVEPPVDIQWTNAAKSKVVLGDRFDRYVAVFREAEAEYDADEYRFELSMDD